MSGRDVVFVVELTEAQLLNAWCQASNDLDKTHKAMKRGLCTEADLVVLRSLYSVLSKAVYARLPAAVKGGAQ